MRVRFQIGERAFCITRNNFYSFGEIENNFDDGMAKAWIEGNIAEPFEDSFSNEEMRDLYEKFINIKEFERKVDLFMMVIAKSNTKVKLVDGTEFLFELTPTKPEEWYYYNKRLSDFYFTHFYRCRFESFKENFDRKLKNFPYYKTLRKKELDRITEILNTDNNEGILYWYNAGFNGEIPLDEKGIEHLFSKSIYHGVANYLQGKAIFDYVVYLHSLDLKKHQESNDEVKFQITGIDVPELVKELAKQKYFNIKFKTDVINWFNGTKPITPIPMDVRANFFLSIIADLCDAKPPFIKNKKIFCYKYIHQSFLFRGEKPKITYIEKVMKPNNENRLICTDKTIPDIQLFKTSV